MTAVDQRYHQRPESIDVSYLGAFLVGLMGRSLSDMCGYWRPIIIIAVNLKYHLLNAEDGCHQAPDFSFVIMVC